MATPSLPPILVVDDSDGDLHLIKRLLGRAGIKNPVVTFDNGQALLSFLSAALSSPGSGLMPSIVFTDLKMPGLDGLDLIKWIRGKKAFRDLPVVMLSDSGEEKDARRAKSLGITHYVQKLPKPDEFANIITSLCK